MKEVTLKLCAAAFAAACTLPALAQTEIQWWHSMTAVNGETVSTLAGFYRKVWALGQAGVEVPLTLYRDGVTFDVRVNSSDRQKFLKAPRMH